MSIVNKYICIRTQQVPVNNKKYNNNGIWRRKLKLGLSQDGGRGGN
jgi:hypothetical protein